MNLKNLLLGSVIVLAAATSQAKETVEVRLKLDSATDYEQTASNVFVGKTDNVSLLIELKATDAQGLTKTEAIGPMNVSATSTDKMTIKGDLIISEGKDGTTIVKAAMSDDEMRVSSQEILRATEETLKQKGKSLVSQMNLKTVEGEAGFQLNVSDLVCKKAEKTICTLSVEMIIRAEK